jgi:hypothetical protein
VALHRGRKLIDLGVRVLHFPAVSRFFNSAAINASRPWQNATLAGLNILARSSSNASSAERHARYAGAGNLRQFKPGILAPDPVSAFSASAIVIPGVGAGIGSTLWRKVRGCEPLQANHHLHRFTQ